MMVNTDQPIYEDTMTDLPSGWLQWLSGWVVWFQPLWRIYGYGWRYVASYSGWLRMINDD